LLLLDKGLISTSSKEQGTLMRIDQKGADYGDGTVRAVSLFQEKHRLLTTGLVDAVTAEAMNGFSEAPARSAPTRMRWCLPSTGRCSADFGPGSEACGSWLRS
jgi:hypothetical protein